jgi:predicted dehydrogenase
MANHMTSKICLIGAGQMALDYAKVLQNLKVDFDVVGRGEKSAQGFESKFQKTVIRGGVQDYLNKRRDSPDYAIVAVSVDRLAEVTHSLLKGGCTKILVEKPGGLNEAEINAVAKAGEQDADIFIAYNRRFYASVIEAKKRIAEDGGVSSFQFEFTEWSNIVEKLPDENVKREWLLANSTHVIDMAFYLGGRPRKISSYVAGSLAWHPSGSRYAGAGISENDALFSYSANWEAPGRWGVEILTRKNRFIFRPLEKLQVQELASVAITEASIDDRLDREFKPGLYLQTKAFLEESNQGLLSITQHLLNFEFYNEIAAGKKAN